MNKKIGIPLLVVALIVVLGAVFMMQKEETPQVVNNNITVTSPEKADEVVQEQKDEVESTEPVVDGSYEVVPSESRAQWTGKKTLIATWVDSGVIAIKDGSFTMESGNVTSGNVAFDMTSIAAETTGAGGGQDKLSTHLKSADFFDVEKYPTATFAFTSATPVEGQANTYMVVGDLTIKGITNSIEFPAVVMMSEGALVTTADITVDRTKWEVKYGSDKFFDNLANNVIDDNFVLSLNVVSRVK